MFYKNKTLVTTSVPSIVLKNTFCQFFFILFHYDARYYQLRSVNISGQQLVWLAVRLPVQGAVLEQKHMTAMYSLSLYSPPLA